MRCRFTIATGERYADGLLSQRTLAAAWNAVDGAMAVSRSHTAEAVCFAAYPEIEEPVAFVRDAVLDLAADLEVSTSLQSGWLACLLGPRDLPAFDPAWRSAMVQSMAAAINRDNGWEGDRLAVLADAVEEAGCSDTAILEHCRGSGQHVRACWVVDGLLGRR